MIRRFSNSLDSHAAGKAKARLLNYGAGMTFSAYVESSRRLTIHD